MRKIKELSESQRQRANAKKYISELKELFDDGGGAVMSQLFGSENGFATRDVYIGGWYVGVVSEHYNERGARHFTVDAGAIGMWGVKCTSFSNGFNKILKKVGV